MSGWSETLTKTFHISDVASFITITEWLEPDGMTPYSRDVVLDACSEVASVSYAYTPASGITAGETVTFSATYLPSDATSPTISWAFSDDGTDGGLQVTHVFTPAGSYVVTVTAENCLGGGFAEYHDTINVTAAAPEDRYIYLPIVVKNY
jgi:PKD repeat protein